MGEGFDEEFDENEALMAWLERHGPDEWHQIALSANWDFVDPKLFEWIIAQPDCDEATALALFWRGGVSWLAAHPDEPHEAAGLLRAILRRWSEDGFARGEIAFPGGVDDAMIRDGEIGRMDAEGTRDALGMPPDMLRDHPGRIVGRREDAPEGFPEEIYPPGYLDAVAAQVRRDP